MQLERPHRNCFVMDPNTTEEPLTGEAKTAIMAHMNEDHGKHMVEYAQYLGNVKNAIG